MIPERFAPQTYALMRIVFALVFLNYGLQKFGLFGGVGGGSVPFLSWPFGVAGFIETVTGFLILIGLLVTGILNSLIGPPYYLILSWLS